MTTPNHLDPNARPEGAGPRPRATLAAYLLALIVIAGFTVRFLYANHGFNDARFHDDRFSLQNVRGVLTTGSLKPANGYYPMMSWLPQALLLDASEDMYRLTGKEFFSIYRKESLSRTGWLIVRLVQIAYSLGAIVMTFVVGRKVFSAPVGLIGGLVMAFLPWQIHSSSTFKPDILITLTVLLSLHWILRTVDRPVPGRYAVAGLGTALALSSKYTGGIMAVVLVAAVFLTKGTIARRALHLCTAGAVSLLASLVLNPYVATCLKYIHRIDREYELKAEYRGGGRLLMPWRILEFITDWTCHGVIPGGLSILGFALLCILVLRRRTEAAERVRLGLFLLSPVVFVLGYAAATRYFKSNNVLPVTAFSALSLAWVLHEGWKRAAAASSIPGRPWARGVLCGLLVPAVAVPGFLFAYRSVVPTTLDLARRFVEGHRHGFPGLVLYVERWDPPRPAFEGGGKGESVAEIDVDRLESVPIGELGRADGVVFHENHVRGAGSRFFDEHMAKVRGDQVGYFYPSLFKARGPAMVAVEHRWRLMEPPVELPVRREGVATVAQLPSAAGAGDFVSFLIEVPGRCPKKFVPAKLLLGDRGMRLHEARKSHLDRTYQSARIRAPEGGGPIRVTAAPESSVRCGVRVSVYRWSEPSAEPTAGRTASRRNRAGSVNAAGPVEAGDND